MKRKNQKVKIIVVMGTRPEAIKMAPLIWELKRFKKKFEVVTISSGQHREMLRQALSVFKIVPDYDLKIMLPDQSLSQISMKILEGLERIFEIEKPDLVLVQGDTPTAFTGALAAFYSRIPVGHVEAGLRTFDKYSPFPEEVNRQLIDVICDFYFVPTKNALKNLLNEGKPRDRIWMTGNTVIDAVAWVEKKAQAFKLRSLSEIDFQRKKVILLTCHRRESLGKKMGQIFQGVREAVEDLEKLTVVFPVHLNPKVGKLAKEILGDNPRIILCEPLSYPDMVLLMKRCFLIVTDSGGLQEEASFFAKPVLVLREKTERVEGVKEGTLKVVGRERRPIKEAIKELVFDRNLYKRMAEATDIYGDGRASQRIRKIIDDLFENK